MRFNSLLLGAKHWRCKARRSNANYVKKGPVSWQVQTRKPFLWGDGAYHCASVAPLVSDHDCYLKSCLFRFWNLDVAISCFAIVFDGEAAEQEVRLFLSNVFMYPQQTWWNDLKSPATISPFDLSEAWHYEIMFLFFIFSHYPWWLWSINLIVFCAWSFCYPDIRQPFLLAF